MTTNDNPARRCRGLRALAAAVAVLGCAPACGNTAGSHDAPSVADAPGAIDAVAAIDAVLPDAAPATLPSTVGQTAGGGAASSPGYRLRVQIGAPQPMGRASSPAYRATLGAVLP